MHPNHILEVGRRDLAATRLLGEPLPTLAPGAVRLEVERLALTANTVTYALTGDLLGYWQFYPAPDADWGRVPAMGWARIVESTRPELAVGSRYYGWWPMAGFVDVHAEPNGRGFRDVGAHREGHAPVYRQALDTAADPLYEPGRDAEDRHALLRGLFQTAFLADDALDEQEDYGATQLLLTSASSKTAIALAELASERGQRVIGLTSAANRDFVAGLGCYAQAVDYADIESLPTEPAVIVDMAGNTGVLDRLHRHLGEALKHSMAIGRSHNDAPRQDIGGVLKPQFFFAPAQAKKRTADWGAERLNERMALALRACVARSRDWMQVESVRGLEAGAATWEALRSGQVPPEQGQILVLAE